jgi:hypothetical protein
MFKFLSNENKGESNSLFELNRCKDLLQYIVDNEQYQTTIYPQSCEFRGDSYIIRSLQYRFDENTNSINYYAQMEIRNYIINVELNKRLHENI